MNLMRVYMRGIKCVANVLRCCCCRRRRDPKPHFCKTQLAQSRPKLVKVRPATEKQQAILAGMGTTSLSPAAKLAAAHAQRGKLLLVQNEARMMALRQQRIAPKRKAAFGDAVAFASSTKRGAAHKRQKIGGTLHRVNGEGGHRLLKIPDTRRPMRTTTPSAAKRK
jgi:hypothetical protein